MKSNGIGHESYLPLSKRKTRHQVKVKGARRTGPQVKVRGGQEHQVNVTGDRNTRGT